MKDWLIAVMIIVGCLLVGAGVYKLEMYVRSLPPEKSQVDIFEDNCRKEVCPGRGMTFMMPIQYSYFLNSICTCVDSTGEVKLIEVN